VTLSPEDAAGWEGTNTIDRLVLGLAPDEHPHHVMAFLDHWAPDVAVWVWGNLRPNLVDEMARRSIALHLVAAESEGFDRRRDRWLPELVGHLVRVFSSASARTESAAQRLERLGLNISQITVEPAPGTTGRVLPYEPSDVDDLGNHLSNRPVWFAAQTQANEWPHILTVHRQALRSSHRLLLVVHPGDHLFITELHQRLGQHNLKYGVWGDGDWPDEAMQVLIADQPDELGLWYRLATVSFMGSSLVPGYHSSNPLDAAALGTAILYGPYVREHLQSYTRLANAGAARMVSDVHSMASSLTELISPDIAADMAHAGWDVVTETAMVVDNVINLVQDSLDARDARITGLKVVDE